MTPEMKEFVAAFIRDNPEANRAHEAMIGRGLSAAWAEAAMAMLLTAACMGKPSHGLTANPKRLDAALRALAEGPSAEGLFADEHEGGGNKPAD